MSRMCVCVSCAKAHDIIEKTAGEVASLYIVTEVSEEHADSGTEEGDLCEVDHDHGESTDCVLVWVCLACDLQYDTEAAAEECCPAWMCTICGYEYSSGGWYASVEQHAASCCVVSCDDCGWTGWSSFMEEHNCSYRGRNMRQTPPWEERGVSVDALYPTVTWQEAWGLNPAKHNVVQAAADFYLLEALSAGLVGTTDGKGNEVVPVKQSPTFRIIMQEADELMAQLCKEWDPILQAYVHIAVGGELRHHDALGGVVSGSRKVAWSGWKEIYKAVGVQALKDAEDLFLEFSGGSYGGPPWATAARILHSRLTGKITSRMFLDRVFNAQHNGGCLLNKVKWYGDVARYDGAPAMRLNDLTYTVLPAHGQYPEPDYTRLLTYASQEVRALYVDSFTYAGHAAKEMGVSLAGRVRRPHLPEQREMAMRRRALEERAEDDAPMTKSKVALAQENWETLTKSAEYYSSKAADEQNNNAINVVCALLSPPSTPGGVPIYTYFTNLAYHYNLMANAAKEALDKALAWEATFGLQMPSCSVCGWMEGCGCYVCEDCGMEDCECDW